MLNVVFLGLINSNSLLQIESSSCQCSLLHAYFFTCFYFLTIFFSAYHFLFLLQYEKNGITLLSYLFTTSHDTFL